MELTVAPGVGYRTADANKGASAIGVIPVDSIFSPVRKVAYRVENTQVGQMTNFDKLVLDVETNGAIEPAEAVSSAGKTLGELMGLFADIGEGAGPRAGRCDRDTRVRPTSSCPSRHSTSPSVPATACVAPRSRRSASWWSGPPTTCSTSPTSVRRASTR
jgi:DNA-directed RNA polymerase alpha subunit